MKPLSFMLIAGEASGDTLAAELVGALRTAVLRLTSAPTDEAQPRRTPVLPQFFGAGGPLMAAAGVELAFDLTRHSVIGLSDVVRNALTFRRLFHQLLRLAIERQPDVILGVDYGGFNLRFARAIRRHIRSSQSWFHPWNPRLVQFVSPQVWASRPGRARVMEDTHDLVLSIFPFEQAWYSERAPKLRVEFVGHPLVERYQAAEGIGRSLEGSHEERVILLPGSRQGELRRHLPVLQETLRRMQAEQPELSATMVLPDVALAGRARSLGALDGVEMQIGNIPEALARARLALSKTGTVTMECAYFGVPTVTFYKTSWSEYHVAKRVVRVNSLTMPNLLAGEEVFPEFIQEAATPENLARAGLELLRDGARREALQRKLARIVTSLGGPGAPRRAAEAVVSLLP